MPTTAARCSTKRSFARRSGACAFASCSTTSTREGLDPVFALLDAEPNIQLRLYNPFTSRGSRGLGFLGDFERLNRRMHNKSFTVDNQAAIVGGRNLADEYFEAGEGVSFADIDVLAVGEAVRAVSTEFDLYWNSGSAYPARLIIDREPAVSRAEFAARARAIGESPTTRAYAEAISRTPQGQALLERRLPFEWTAAQVVHDDPEKTLDLDDEAHLQLLPKLIQFFGPPMKELDLVSPYFVPGKFGTEALVALARRGVRVRILTNSLAGTDEVSVHSGYARRRKELLRAGVQLFEIKPTAAPILKRGEEIGKHSTAGLHAKTFAVDQRRVFVGSFNFDPRSAKLNTEMGLIIDSAVARRAAVADARQRLAGAGLSGHARRQRLASVGRRPRRDGGRRARDRLGPANEGPHLLVAADRVAALTRACRRPWRQQP